MVCSGELLFVFVPVVRLFTETADFADGYVEDSTEKGYTDDQISPAQDHLRIHGAPSFIKPEFWSTRFWVNPIFGQPDFGSTRFWVNPILG